MIDRLLYKIAFSEEWGRQMRFISGPRQSGKTTLAKYKLNNEGFEKLYYLWDLRTVRNRYRENEMFFTVDSPPGKRKQWVCFDEIHKMPKWKNILKGIFDEMEDYYYFIVTGSAKFDIAKKAGDSLAGRYFTFHLFPLCLTELRNLKGYVLDPPQNLKGYILAGMEPKKGSQKLMENLLELSGFPEPFINQSNRFKKKWAEDYIETVIKEDIGALTRITDREYLYELYKILPEMVGSPISESSLASHIQVSPVTIKNYLRKLQDFYLIFLVRPYSKNIKRSLLRASKCYLFDWTGITDPGARFENYIACELKSKISFWMDMTGIEFGLNYIRNKEKQETDFLVTRGKKPWLLFESKLKDGSVAKHNLTIAAQLNVPLIQVCKEPDIAALQKKNVFRISASRFFG